LSDIPEEKRWYGGIGSICTSGSVAYKSNPSMITKWVGSQKVNFNNITGKNCADWTQTTGNPDTVWAYSNHIPLITYPIDSLILRVSSTDIVLMSAKCLYYSSEPCCDAVRTTETHSVPNSNSILYFLPSSPLNPNMKLQVISVEIDSSSTEPPGSIFRNYVVTGFNLRWAIDSLGNGVFDKRTSIAKNSQRAGYTSTTKISKYLKLNVSDKRNSQNNILDCIDHQVYFSLKGEKVSGNSGNGVFVKP
jgi:hypothetical protein